MSSIFAKRRARLLAMKAIRDSYVPGGQLVACPKCGGESQRKDGISPSAPSAAITSPSGPITGSVPFWTPAVSGS